MMEFTKMSVDDIRAKLVELGLTQEEADGIKGKGNLTSKYLELTAVNHETPKVEMGELNLNPEDVVAQASPAFPENDVPNRTKPEWHDYVMSHFTDDELVEDPNSKKKLPNVDGLRRVSEVLVGAIMLSKPIVHSSPHSQNLTATVSYSVVFNTDEGMKEFGGAADCHEGNIDQTYAIFPTANAETRAEARALRKALGLRKILAAEEASMTPKVDSWLPDNVSEMQLTLLDKKCKEADIDVLKFINMGKNQYPDFTKIPRDIAGLMIMEINELHREAKKIPDDIKGYKENWR